MSRFVVLGSDGFIGSAICRRIDSLRDVGPAVRHVRHHAPRQPTPLPVEPLDLQRASLDDIDMLIERTDPTVVVNCVGCQFGDSETMLDVNVHVVAKLVRVLADHPEVLFVQLGSSAEYGVNSVGRSVREYDPPSPITEYGRTKLTATRLVLGAAAQGRVRGIVLRVFSPIGRGTSVRSMPGRAMTQIEAAMESGVDAIDFGPLSDSQDFIDVDDVASAAVSAGLSEYAIGALLNVGRGRAVRSRTLVELLVSISGYPGRVVEEVGRPSRPGRRSWQQADMEATFRRLEWRPRRSLSASVADMWNHRHHGWTT